MRYSLTTVLFATAVLALPLNINMGAYSPALVVGDGAIGFKGTESVTNLMNTLQGAAANTAAANGAAAPAAAAPATQPAAAEGAVPAQAQVDGGLAAAQGQDQAAATLLEGMGKNVVTRQETDEDLDEVDEEGLDDVADIEIEDRDVELEGEIEEKEKRDLAGFNTALSYASAALKSGPEVQLGTGEGGSGVGITQKQGGAGNATRTG